MCNVNETGVMVNLGLIKGAMGDLSKENKKRILMIIWTQFKFLKSAMQRVPVVHCLSSGKRMTFKPLQNFEANFGAPSGSKVIMSQSASIHDC